MPLTKDAYVIPRYIVQMDYPGSQFKIGQVIVKHKYLNGKWYIPNMLYDPDDYPLIFRKITEEEYTAYINQKQQ